MLDRLLGGVLGCGGAQVIVREDPESPVGLLRRFLFLADLWRADLFWVHSQGLLFVNDLHF